MSETVTPKPLPALVEEIRARIEGADEFAVSSGEVRHLLAAAEIGFASMAVIEAANAIEYEDGEHYGVPELNAALDTFYAQTKDARALLQKLDALAPSREKACTCGVMLRGAFNLNCPASVHPPAASGEEKK